MKKLIAMILTLALLLPAAAWACESPVLIAKCGGTITYTDASWWALTDGCVLAGVKDCGEIVPRLSVQSTRSQYVAGLMDNGWMREAGMIRTLTADGQPFGLTKLCSASITIYAEYVPLCESVIHDLLGDDVEISANSLAACALWWDGEYVADIFHPSYSDRLTVGYVTFNYEDVTPFCLGHFGDELRFGLMCGFREADPAPVYVDVNVTAEAQANAEAVADAQAGAQANAGAYAYAGANGNAYAGAVSANNSGSVVVQVNVGIWQTVKNCIRLLKECGAE